MNTENDPESDFLAENRPRKNWLDELSWYLLVLGFIAILVAGLCFFLFRNRPLTYADFSIDANTLGKYLMMFGLACYVVGRAIHYTRKIKKLKESS